MSTGKLVKTIKRKGNEYKLWLFGYSWLPVKPLQQKPVIIIMFNNRLTHGGLLDRIKGIISTVIIARQLGYDYKVFAHPSFPLQQFLQDNPGNLYLTQEQIQYNGWNSKPVYFYNTFTFSNRQILSLFQKGKKQYHFYCNTDVLKHFFPQYTAEQLNTLWRATFHELFRFAPAFATDAASILPNGTPTCGIHLRFHSLLGDFKEVFNLPIPAAEQEALLQHCINSVTNIISDTHFQQYYIASDSSIFLQRMQQHISMHPVQKQVVIARGQPAHIDVDHSSQTLYKTLQDFYLLSTCTSIYQVLAPKMYNSQFSRYAAVIGNAPYILHRI
jgi:hypothetical protein